MSNVAKNAATFEIPYRGIGYRSAVQALINLGINELHSFDKILPAVKKAMGDEYKAFAAWKSGKKTAFNVDKRILTNVMVCSRIDYGSCLREVGYEVRWDGRQKLAGLFKLDKAPKAKPTAKKTPAAKTAAKKAK